MPDEYFCTYEGSEEAQSCQPDEFCTDPSVTSYEPNMELADSYNNFILKMDLTCASNMEIGLINSSVLIGTVLALPIIPRLADKYGRYKFMFAANLTGLFAIVLLMITDSYNVLILCFLLLGSSGVARVLVAAQYLYESLSKSDYQIVYTAFTALEGVLAVFMTLYF